MALMLAKGKAMNLDMCSAWYNLLKDYPADKVEAAIKQAVYSPDDFPTVGKLVSSISQVGAGAIEAWFKVVESASKNKHPEGLAGDVVRIMGGIDKIGYCESEYKMDQLKRNFIEIYKNKSESLEHLPEIGFEKKHLPEIGFEKKKEIAG
jgi:hypothetical protein